ncbi:MAG TPA: LysR family transcriptional regulator [Actinomycetes bacterium]|nr:LysR family transcriptional regulator [Actinomycetes bacterium]
MKFDLHRLQLLRELSRLGTVSAVADTLSYSTSSISQQLAVLETEIGTPLLVPDGRRVRLTPQAEILVKHTGAVLMQLEGAEAEISSSLGSVVGVVRFATIQTAALSCVPEMLSRLSHTHPDLRVQVTLAEPDIAIPGLLTREFDLVCDEMYPEHTAVRSRDTHLDSVAEDPMRVAFREPPAGVSAAGVSLADFAEHPWVMELPGSPGREWSVAACRRAGFEPRVEHQTSDNLVQAELVARGLAVAFLPDLLWFGRKPSFHLRWMEPTHVRSLVTTCRAGSQDNPAITTVRDAFADAFEISRPDVVDR